MRKLVAAVTMLLVIVWPARALACGGLVNPNGTVSLVKTTTLAAYADGVEHYITSFSFAGGGAELGSIIPLPGIPSEVERGGDWTLQRLVEEVTPRPEVLRDGVRAVAASADAATVILEKQIDALDITILEGGGDAVGRWAADNGFELSPDAPEVLSFYAARSPIFMAARFDAGRAAELGQGIGEGTPIHLAIPTPNPWVPLRILGLGLGRTAPVQADVFLLTERTPALLPEPRAGDEGLILERSERASDDLLRDLRSDRGMRWVPDAMHLTYLRLDEDAGDLTYDLAIDASGYGRPSPLAAGFGIGGASIPGTAEHLRIPGLVVAGIAAALVWAVARRKAVTGA